MPTPVDSPTGDTKSEGLGIIDHAAFAKRWPALAYNTAMEVAGETGVDTSDASNVVKVMQSRTYKEKVNNMAKNRDDRMLSRIAGTFQPLPDQNASELDQTQQIFQGKEQNTINQIRARGVVTQRQIDAQNKLDEMADFDREAFKAKRLKEMNPSADLDQRMLALRMQAFTAKAMLRNELKGLSPSARDAAVNARLQVFADGITSLKEIRDARIRSAESQIDAEIDAHNEDYRAAKSKVSALKTLMDTIEQTGEDSDALASIRLDWLKEKKKLVKSGQSGIVDEEETLANAILNEYVSDYNETPTPDQIKEAHRQAKDVIKRRKNLVSGAKGQPSAVAGVRLSTALGTAPLGLPSRYAEEE